MHHQRHAGLGALCCAFDGVGCSSRRSRLSVGPRDLSQRIWAGTWLFLRYVLVHETTTLNSQGYHGYVLVYSISSRRSLETLKSINLKLLNLTGSNDVPRVLVGNKADLEQENLRCASFTFRCLFLKSVRPGR
jgi:hypothetical protein